MSDATFVRILAQAITPVAWTPGNMNRRQYDATRGMSLQRARDAAEALAIAGYTIVPPPLAKINENDRKVR